MNMGIMRFGGRLIGNLFSKPATRNYPAEPREYTERTRGHVEFDPSDCILCNICGKKCPTGAIHADKAKREISINRMMCIQCSYCVESCPKSCLSMHGTYVSPDSVKVIDTFEVPERDKPTEKQDSD